MQIQSYEVTDMTPVWPLKPGCIDNKIRKKRATLLMNYKVCRTALATPGLLVIQLGSEQFNAMIQIVPTIPIWWLAPGDQELQAGKDWKN